MIYTTYFANLRKLPDNIIPISICGKAPTWYHGLQFKQLAPKYDFFMKWKETHDNDYYINSFHEKVLNPLEASEVVYDLYSKIGIDLSEHGVDFSNENSLNGEKHIALVCYEKPGDFCHRHLVAEWLNANGFPCKEILMK